MGYQDVTVYKLKFEDRDGLEVSAAGLSAGDLFDLMDLAAKVPQDAAGAKLDAETRHIVETMMETLAASLTAWNVEDLQGRPVPLTVAGLKSQKLGLVMDILTAWMSAQNDVDESLGKGSASSATSGLERSLPMEPLSPSPGS